MENERVALYARVSTLAGQSPEMQLAEGSSCANTLADAGGTLSKSMSIMASAELR